MPFNARVIVYDEVVRQKLLMAAPHILANNRALVEAMLKGVKPVVHVETPLGPGHFGYHGRDTLEVEIHSHGVKTIGKLKAAVQLYWREYGTRGSAKRHKGISFTAREVKAISAFSGQGSGERARMVAHKALAKVRSMINVFYGGQAAWWRH